MADRHTELGGSHWQMRHDLCLGGNRSCFAFPGRAEYNVSPMGIRISFQEVLLVTF